MHTRRREELRVTLAADHTVRYNFIDLNDRSCSIQESPLATRRALYLGLNDKTTEHGRVVPALRMLITQDQAKWLAPMLEHFGKTGNLPAN
ncbi:MAG: hypothetical protein K2W95_15845 [Candidatus Obscuribacterales bacterium]|nr:hypothetical protein [Candidatus Obscuribacterales bacterium]